MSQAKTHLCPSSSLWNSPISAGFFGGKRRDLPPCGVLGGKNRGFFRKRFRLSILASRRRSRSLCGIRKWFIQFLFFGGLAFFETQKGRESMTGRGTVCVDILANSITHTQAIQPLLSCFAVDPSQFLVSSTTPSCSSSPCPHCLHTPLCTGFNTNLGSFFGLEFGL